MKYIILTIGAFLLIIIYACSPTGAVFEKNQISLDVDAEVTETWVTLRSTPIEKNASYFVTRDDSLIFEGKLTQSDTLIHDENLEPSSTYNYAAYAIKAGEQTKTVRATTTTMDTTSHDFTWEVFEWSGVGSSILFDVAIINENDIWAVGEIHTIDTDQWNQDSTEWILPFNAMHWDGQIWTLLAIKPTFRGTKISPTIDGIFSFSSTNVWFCAGGAPVHWNGDIEVMYHLWDMGVLNETDGGVTQVWGSSPENIFFAGQTGTIVHYNGQTWTKIESETDSDINDIWGSLNGDPLPIYAAACNKYTTGVNKLLKLNNNNVSEESWPYEDKKTYSVWFENEHNTFVCGGGIYRKNRSGKWNRYAEIPHIFLNRIRGNNINDLFLVGDFGLMGHYNGNSWKIFDDISVQYNGLSTSIVHSVAIKNNTVIAVGQNNPKAILIVGKR